MRDVAYSAFLRGVDFATAGFLCGMLVEQLLRILPVLLVFSPSSDFSLSSPHRRDVYPQTAFQSVFLSFCFCYIRASKRPTSRNETFTFMRSLFDGAQGKKCLEEIRA